MFARLFSLVSLALSAVARITVDAPANTTSPIQCEDYQISWTGGTSPFDIRLTDGANNFVEGISSDVHRSPLQWTVNQAAGTVLSVLVLDSTGLTGSSPRFTIQSSSKSSCLSTSVSSRSSFATSNPGSSTAVSTIVDHTSSAVTTFISEALSTASATASATSSTTPPALSITSAASPSASRASLSSSKALSSGAIVGIIVGALSVVVGVAWVMRHSRRAASAHLPNEAVTGIEPFPWTPPGSRQPSGTGSSTPAGWERKGRQYSGPGTTERNCWGFRGFGR